MKKRKTKEEFKSIKRDGHTLWLSKRFLWSSPSLASLVELPSALKYKTIKQSLPFPIMFSILAG